MIQYLKVDGLNNRLDDEFEFNQDVNIFTGPNGSGKTTLLKLIWYLISGHLEHILSEIPFSSLSIKTDSFSLTMLQKKSDEIELKLKFIGEELVTKPINVDSDTKVIDRKNIDEVNELQKRIAQTTKSSLFFPTFRRIEGGFSKDPRDLEDSVRTLLPLSEMLQITMFRFSSDVSVNGHKFIASISTEDISELLTQKHADIYEEINDRQSQVLEDISEKIQNNPNKDRVTENSKDASAVLNAIQNVNMERDKLSKPFSVLSELTRKILRYKAIRVTGRIVRGETSDGITLGEGRDGITVGETKDAISSDMLSAGEKQMLSFLCYNAFYKKTAVFIDEPELSLHIDWQRPLFPTLLEQGQYNQFFVATHSPFIYTLYPDKEFMLNDTQGSQGQSESQHETNESRPHS